MNSKYLKIFYYKTLITKHAIFVVSILLLSISIFSLRFFIFNEGVIGHNWDWSIPALLNNLKQIPTQFLYIWNVQSLGYYNTISSLGSPAKLFLSISVLPAFIGISGGVISKSVLVIAMLISGLSMFILVKSILSDGIDDITIFICSLASGIFYSFSPFLFNEFIGGAITQYFSYSIIPLCLFTFLKALETAKFKYKLFFIFLLSAIIMSLQNFIFTVLIICLYVFIFKKINKVNTIKALPVLLLFIMLNSYFFLPLISSIFTSINIPSGEDYLILSNIKTTAPTITKILFGEGYVNRDFFIGSLVFDKSIWLVSAYSLLILTLIGGLMLANRLKKPFLFWSFIYLVSILFATGGNDLLGDQIYNLYVNFPTFMGIFRSIQHFNTIVTLSFAILLGIGSFSILNYICCKSRRKFVIACVTLFILLLILINPWFTGNLGYDHLKSRGGGNNVYLYMVPEGYIKIIDEISEDVHDYRILFLPSSFSPYYMKNEYQEAGQGGDPIVGYSPKPPLFGDMMSPGQSKITVEAFEQNIYNESIFIKYIQIFNIKKIILRGDVLPNFGDLRGQWDITKTKYILDNNFKNESYKYVSLYTIPDSSFLPHIYSISSQIIVYNFSAFIPVISSKDFIPSKQNIFILSQNQDKTIAEISSSTNSYISFQKINPIKYKIKIENANEPFYLTFSESFHPLWKAYINTDMMLCNPISTYETIKVTECQQEFKFFELKDLTRIFSKPIPEEKHFLVNGYANAWYIDPHELGTGENFTVTLYFKPQSYFYLGLFISGITFIVCICYLFWDWRKTKIIKLLTEEIV